MAVTLSRFGELEYVYSYENSLGVGGDSVPRNYVCHGPKKANKDM